jgi:hypothetical protein
MSEIRKKRATVEATAMRSYSREPEDDAVTCCNIRMSRQSIDLKASPPYNFKFRECLDELLVPLCE